MLFTLTCMVQAVPYLDAFGSRDPRAGGRIMTLTRTAILILLVLALSACAGNQQAALAQPAPVLLPESSNSSEVYCDTGDYHVSYQPLAGQHVLVTVAEVAQTPGTIVLENVGGATTIGNFTFSIHGKDVQITGPENPSVCIVDHTQLTPTPGG